MLVEHDGKHFQPVLYDLEEVATALERVAVVVRAGLCHELFFFGEGDKGLIWFTGMVTIEDDEDAELIVYGTEVEVNDESDN